MNTIETLEKLKAYQEVLGERVALEEQMDALPKTLQAQSEMLSRLKRTFSERSAEFSATEQRVRDLRQGLAEAESAREKAELQMDGITTQREYEAINKEIRDATDKEQSLRKDIQKEERLFAEIEDDLRKNESTIQGLNEEIEKKRADIDAERDTMVSQIETLKTEEVKFSEGIGREIIFKLERIIRNKKGTGVVPVHGVVCSGCHMILPANFVNELRDEENTKVHFCPYCSRILFYEETEEAPEFMGDIESGSLADLAEYSEEGEEEGESEEDDDTQDKEDQEREFSGGKKASRRNPYPHDDYADESDD